MKVTHGTITFGELSDFLFSFLGTDWFAQNQISAKQQSRYINEEMSFASYNIRSKDNLLSNILDRFQDEAIKTYGASQNLLCFTSLPRILSLQFSNSFPETQPKNINIWQNITFYAVFLVQHKLKVEKIKSLFTETFSSIFKEFPQFETAKLSESSCKWNSLKTVLDNAADKNSNDLSAFSTKLLRHYLFLNAKKAFKRLFQIDDDAISFLLNTVVNDFPIPLSTPEDCFSVTEDFYEKCTKKVIMMAIAAKQKPPVDVYEKMCFRHALCPEGFDYPSYFMSGNCPVKETEANTVLNNFISGSPEYLITPYWYWFKARTLVFQQEFYFSETDLQRHQEILELFRKAFDCGKYILGKYLGEFLEDAISAEIYFNPKNKIKDKTIENSQDEFSEGYSLNNNNATEYWEFGYAAGFFAENSKQTYLFAYNRGKSFWNSFYVKKFSNYDRALQQFKKDMVCEEISICENLKSLDSTMTNREKVLETFPANKRKKLSSTLERYYSSLSIAIMNGDLFWKAPKYAQDSFLTMINRCTPSTLAIFDENGATPLIRALYEYKKIVLGFSKEFCIERSRLFSRLYQSIELQKMDNDDPDSMIKVFYQFAIEYNRIHSEYPANNSELDKAQFFYKEVCLKLIQKYTEEALRSEAIELDCHNSVSALQLAIECGDLDLVKAITAKIKKVKLHQYYISKDYVNPLQYAIRYYDLVIKNAPEQNKNIADITKKIPEICKRKLTGAGIQENTRQFSEDYDTFKNVISSIPFETIGLSLAGNRFSNLRQVIFYLADITEKISVDTMYYLADAEGYNDILEISDYLIKTKKVDVAGTNYEWSRYGIPAETLMARCIRNLNNLPLLRQLLNDSWCVEQFKPVINRIVTNVGKNSKGEYKIVTTTDTDFLFAELIQRRRIIQHHKDEKEYDKALKEWCTITKEFLTLFYNAGAKLDIPDNQNKTVLDYIKIRRAEGLIPDEVIPPQIMELL